MSKRRRKKRGSTRYLFFFVLISLTATGLWNLTTYFLKDIDAFNIKKIEVVGYKNLDPSFLESLSDEFIGVNIFKVKKQNFIRKYENIVRVKRVSVSRRLPSTMMIEITERLGILYVKATNGEFYPIDDEFIVLDKDDFYFFEDIPLANINIDSANIQVGEKIHNETLDRIVDLHNNIMKINKTFINNISEYYIRKNDIAFIDSHAGSRVVLGETDIELKLNRYLFLYNNKGFNKNTLIDLRFKDQVIVKG